MCDELQNCGFNSLSNRVCGILGKFLVSGTVRQLAIGFSDIQVFGPNDYSATLINRFDDKVSVVAKRNDSLLLFRREVVASAVVLGVEVVVDVTSALVTHMI